jgi:hypothetical protein
MTPNKFQKEVNEIKTIATVNGFNTAIVDTLIHKQTRNKHLKTVTNLKPIKDPINNRRVRINYNKSTHSKIDRIFENHNLKVVNSNNNKIKNLVHSTKDTTPPL